MCLLDLVIISLFGEPKLIRHAPVRAQESVDVVASIHKSKSIGSMLSMPRNAVTSADEPETHICSSAPRNPMTSWDQPTTIAPPN